MFSFSFAPRRRCVGLVAALAATSLALLCSRPAEAQSGGSWDFKDYTFNLEEAKATGANTYTPSSSDAIYLPAWAHARMLPGADGTSSASASLKGTARIIATWTPYSSYSPIPKPPATVTVRIGSSATAEYANDSQRPAQVQASSPELNNGFDDPKKISVYDPAWSTYWNSSGSHLKTFSTKDARWDGTRKVYTLVLPLDIKMASSVKAEGTNYSPGAVTAKLGQPYVDGDPRTVNFYASPNDVFAILKDEPNDKEIDAYASLDWFNDGVVENPLTRIFSGSAKFFLSASKDGNPINLQNYKWSTSPEPYTPSTPPADTGSESSKNYSWNLGSVADTDPSSFPKSTTTTVTATDPSDGVQISGKAKINWHLRPATLMSLNIGVEPIHPPDSDNDDGANDIWSQIEDVEAAKQEVVQAGGIVTKTTVESANLTIEFMVPDEFDLALGVGRSAKVGKFVYKFAGLARNISSKVASAWSARRAARGRLSMAPVKGVIEAIRKGRVGTRHPNVN